MTREVGGRHPRPDWMRRVLTSLDGEHPHYLRSYQPPPDPERRAGVLMLFGPDAAGGEDVVLTERSAALRSHPGQVSFPGGRTDDGEESVDAALREAEEEVGVDPASVEVVSLLPELYLTPSRNAVTPVLGWWHTPGPLGVHSEIEVERVLRVPVEALVDPANRFTARFLHYKGPAFEVGDLFVWGFTAGLLDAVLDLAGLTRPWNRDLERDLPERVRSPWMRGDEAR